MVTSGSNRSVLHALGWLLNAFREDVQADTDQVCEGDQLTYPEIDTSTNPSRKRILGEAHAFRRVGLCDVASTEFCHDVGPQLSLIAHTCTVKAEPIHYKRTYRFSVSCTPLGMDF